MKALGSIAALVAGIRDEAAADAEAIAAGADEAVAHITADASCPPVAAAGATALAAARERARIRIAQEDWHDAREAVAEREAWIQRAVALGARQLRERQDAPATRAMVGALAREAIARLPAGPIEIVVAAGDAPALDRAWRAEVSASGDPDHIAIVTGTIEGGCLARTPDGRASFDNTFDARAERLQAAWRAALADLYDRVTAPPAEPRGGLP
jgi:vacuolar-type H+-ATPase subunit E/Vma4